MLNSLGMWTSQMSRQHLAGIGPGKLPKDGVRQFGYLKPENR